ncbi:MAG: transporter substrate-binding domain-containing protein [Desulfobacter sp.]|nr:MAG: transporter substrate-binding domain-containing protein [Desulfobacter sp.]
MMILAALPVFFALIPFMVPPALAGQPQVVTLQLSAPHQFQFAGYYTAKEKGFYRKAGLDVLILEGGPGADVAGAVAAGDADFGILGSERVFDQFASGPVDPARLNQYRPDGEKPVIMGFIYRHSSKGLTVDLLFSSARFLSLNQEKAAVFRRASLKGWQYTLTHTHEVIDLIMDTYQPDTSRSQMEKDAALFRSVIFPGLAGLGQLESRVIRSNGQTYMELDRSPMGEKGLLAGFIYHGAPPESVRVSLTPGEALWLKRHPRVRVANEMNWAPYNFNKYGKPKGLAIEYFQRMAEILGIEPVFIDGHTRAELLEMFKQKQIDIMPDFYRNTEREPFTLFTPPYTRARLSVFVRNDAQNALTLETLKGRKVGILKGDDYLPAARKRVPGLLLEEGEDELGLIRDLASGRLDAILGDPLHIFYLAQDNDIKNIALAFDFHTGDDQEVPASHHIGIRNDWPVLHRLVKKAMRLMDDDEIRALENKWGAGINRKVQLTPRELAYLRKHPVVRVSNELEWPPFDFAIGGQAQGFSIDLLRLMAKRIGVSLEFVNGYTWAQLLEMFQRRDIDVIHSLWKTPERAEIGLFTAPYFNSRNHFVIHRDSPGVKDVQDLYGKTVALPAGWVTKSFLEVHHPAVHILAVDNMDQAFEAVNKGEAHATIEIGAVARYHIKKNLLTDLRISERFTEFDRHSPKSLHILVRRDRPVLYQLFEKAMAAVTQEEMAELRTKWLGREEGDMKLDLLPGEYAYLDSRGPIRIAVDPDWMPFECINAKGEHEGMGADFVSLISNRIDKPFILEPTRTWLQSMTYGRERKCDVWPLAMATPERSRYMSFTVPLMTFPIVVATRAQEPFVESLDRILDKPLGVVKGYALGELLRSRYPGIGLVEANTVGHGLAMVRQGSLFGFLDSVPALAHQIRKMGGYDLKINGKFDIEWSLSMGVRKDDPQLLGILDKAVRSVTTEERQGIYNKWIAVKYEQNFDYSFIWKIFMGGILVFGAVFFWNRHLVAMNRKIQIADRFKSEFLANMSHEIRTPMNAIMGLTDLVLLTELTGRQRGFLEKIRVASASLLRLLNDILDFSKIEAGKLSLESIDFKLGEVLGDVEGLIGPRAREKGLSFDLEIENGVPEDLSGDPLRLGQVILNLADNAVKFTETGWVRITAGVETGARGLPKGRTRLRFAVTDTGIGMTSAQADNLFTSFVQADGTTTRKYGGTGLGLSICRRLVELMNGNIELKTECGRGSCFSFSCEFGVVQRQTDTAGTDPSHGAVMPEKMPFDTARLKKIRGARILLVEDNPINQEVAAELLKSQSFAVEIADTGEQAVEILTACSRRGREQGASNGFAAVLMDIQMPVMDGYTATRKIRELPGRSGQIPIITMTAHAMAGEKEKCLGAGMNDYLSKPINPDRLFSALVKWIEPLEGDETRDVHASAEAPEQDSDLPGDLPGIDISGGLARTGGNKMAYYRILTRFCHEQADALDGILNALETGDAETAARRVHTIKGVAGNIGAGELHTAASYLEEQIKAGMDKLPEASLSAFVNAFNEVMEPLGQLKVKTADKGAPVPLTGEAAQNRKQGMAQLIDAFMAEVELDLPRSVELWEAVACRLDSDVEKDLDRKVRTALDAYDSQEALENARLLSQHLGQSVSKG